MLKELNNRKKYLNNQKIDSIYFGGGTPSILKSSEIKSILFNIYKNYSIQKEIEITLECNPDDLTKKKLLEFKRNGINRLSIGVQSFNDLELKWMNRSHNAKEAINCINIAKKLGFQNISIDLMYGIPNQKLEIWKKNLNIMFDLGIQHFSAYCLTVEEKTVLKKLIKKKKLIPLDDEKKIDQYYTLTNLAKENNFIQYEISNFGKENFFSKHNIGYWKERSYIGIGPSAHSYNGETRRWNISSNKSYIREISKDNCYYEKEKLSIKERYNEYVFLSLRTMWGIDIKKLNNTFGNKIKSHFLKELNKWLIDKKIIQQGNTFILTENGKIFVDKISADLFIV